MSLVTFGGGAGNWGPLVDDSSEQIRIIDLSHQNGMASKLESVECLAGWKFPGWLLESLPNLKWIQAVSVGVDDFVNNPAISPSVTITNTRGIYADSIAEYVIWSLLTLSRGYHNTLANQAKRRWAQLSADGLMNKTLGIVGMGSVGQAVATRARAFGMRTVGVVRDPNRATGYPEVDDVASVEEIESHIPEFDALVLSLPLTASTRGLINDGVIAKMKHNLILVNISREEITDYKSIGKALMLGNFGGAALDVFEKDLWAGIVAFFGWVTMLYGGSKMYESEKAETRKHEQEKERYSTWV